MRDETYIETGALDPSSCGARSVEGHASFLRKPQCVSKPINSTSVRLGRTKAGPSPGAAACRRTAAPVAFTNC